MSFIRAFQRDIICGIICIICIIMSSMCKVIRSSLQGTKKLHLHKYYICAKNCECSSAVYVAFRKILQLVSKLRGKSCARFLSYIICQMLLKNAWKWQQKMQLLPHMLWMHTHLQHDLDGLNHTTFYQPHAPFSNKIDCQSPQTDLIGARELRSNESRHTRTTSTPPKQA